MGSGSWVEEDAQASIKAPAKSLKKWERGNLQGCSTTGQQSHEECWEACFALDRLICLTAFVHCVPNKNLSTSYCLCHPLGHPETKTSTKSQQKSCMIPRGLMYPHTQKAITKHLQCAGAWVGTSFACLGSRLPAKHGICCHGLQDFRDLGCASQGLAVSHCMGDGETFFCGCAGRSFAQGSLGVPIKHSLRIRIIRVIVIIVIVMVIVRMTATLVLKII